MKIKFTAKESKILKEWAGIKGISLQKIKLVEEFAELTQAICKFRCSGGSYNDNIIEEFVDVCIVVEQLRLKLALFNKDLNRKFNKDLTIDMFVVCLCNLSENIINKEQLSRWYIENLLNAFILNFKQYFNVPFSSASFNFYKRKKIKRLKKRLKKVDFK